MEKKEIGEILKKIRLESGKTQKEVAALIGRTQQIVGHWETGYSQPDANTLFDLCKIYGTTVDEAFGFSKNKTTQKKKLSPDTEEVAFRYETVDFETKNNIRFLLKLPLLKEEIAEELFPSVEPKLTLEDEKELELIKQEMLAEKKGITSSASISVKDA